MKEDPEARRVKLNRSKGIVGLVNPKPWRKYTAIAMEALVKEPLQSLFRLAAASGFMWLLLYWASIKYVPDVTLASLLLFLVSAALVGGGFVFVYVLGFVVPHALWGSFWDNVDSLQKRAKPKAIGGGVTPPPESVYPHKTFFFAMLWLLVTLLSSIVMFSMTQPKLCLGWTALAIFLHLGGLGFVLVRLKWLTKEPDKGLVGESLFLIFAIAFSTLVPFILVFVLVHGGEPYPQGWWVWFMLGLMTIAAGFLIYAESYPPHRYRLSRAGTMALFSISAIAMVFIPTGAPGQIAKAVAVQLGLTQPNVDLYVKPDACSAVPLWLAGKTCSGDEGKNILHGIHVLNRIGAQWLLEATTTPECGITSPGTSLLRQANAVPLVGAPYRFTLKGEQILSAGVVPKSEGLAELRCRETSKSHGG